MSDQITIIGVGKIGEALVAGLISSGSCNPIDITALDCRPERLEELSKKFEIQTTLDGRDGVQNATLIVLAVKPQDLHGLLAELRSSIGHNQTIVSVVAGVTTNLIEKSLGIPARVVRAMPNTPMIVHEGIAGLAAGRAATEEDILLAEKLLGCVGGTTRVEERVLDAVTAVSGSGPAYFALVAELMIESGTLLGLSHEASTDLVLRTMFGTAKLLRDQNMSPIELREAVTSPGGTTLAAINELERAGVREAFLNAIQAAHDRSRELAKPESS